MTGIQKTLAIVLLLSIFLVTFICGVLVGKEYFSKTTTVYEKTDSRHAEEYLPLHGGVTMHTGTVLTYQPKPEAKAGEIVPDIDIQTGKPELNVEVNGERVEVQKSSDEKHVFDKGQFKVTQDNVATFKVAVDPVDNTKDYGVGLGINTDGKEAAIITAPINKEHHVEGWVYGDTGHKAAGGIMIRF